MVSLPLGDGQSPETLPLPPLALPQCGGEGYFITAGEESKSKVAMWSPLTPLGIGGTHYQLSGMKAYFLPGLPQYCPGRGSRLPPSILLRVNSGYPSDLKAWVKLGPQCRCMCVLGGVSCHRLSLFWSFGYKE